jgi:glycosidase
MPQIPDYRARTIYFMVADRFNAPRPFNPYVDPEYPNTTNRIDCFVSHCASQVEFRKYWGGSIRGIIDRLPYLSDLGATAIWVTPLMENVRNFGGIGPPSYGAAYHGYWVQNYDRVNAHFGSWSDVNALSFALHRAGMRYIQDITLNDSNPNNAHAFGALFRGQDSDEPFIKSYQNDFDPQYPGMRYYKHYQSDPRCKDAPPNDNQWTYWQLHHCLLADLSGFNQLDPTVAQYLINAGGLWIANGVDGFRLDAIKFVFPKFVPEFTNAAIADLQSLGLPAPYIVGEWSGGGVGDRKSLAFANAYARYHVNILDFQLSIALNQFVGGHWEVPSQQLDAQGLDAMLHARVSAFDGRDDWQGTFIDNHDQIRTLVRLIKLGDRDASDRDRRLDLATAILLTVRGIPILMYGDEQYLAFDDPYDIPPADVNTGDDDPYNRVGMKRWDETTPNFLIVAALSRLRRSNAAIASGSYETLYADADVLIYQRREGSDTVYIAVNRGVTRRIALNRSLSLRPGVHRGVLHVTGAPNSLDFVNVTKGRAVFYLAPLSAFVVTGS